MWLLGRLAPDHKTADRQEPTEALATKVTRLTEKLTKLKDTRPRPEADHR
jgi:hypothetical protein